MFSHLITPCCYIFVRRMLEHMFTLYMKTCLHQSCRNIYKMFKNMFISCLKHVHTIFVDASISCWKKCLLYMYEHICLHDTLFYLAKLSPRSSSSGAELALFSANPKKTTHPTPPAQESFFSTQAN